MNGLECDAGGTAVATACTAAGDRYTLSGCTQPAGACVRPADTTGYSYGLASETLAQVGFTVPGHSPAACIGAPATCTGTATAPTCTGAAAVCTAGCTFTAATCTGTVTVTAANSPTGVAITTQCDAQGSWNQGTSTAGGDCATGDGCTFTSGVLCSGTATAPRCDAAATDAAGCAAGCVFTPSDPACALAADSSACAAAGNCVFTAFAPGLDCARGYTGTAVATVCAAAGQPYALSGCTLEHCALPKAAPGYATERRPGPELTQLSECESTICADLSTPSLDLPPRGEVIADDFALQSIAGRSTANADLGAVSCAAGYELDVDSVVCAFQDGRPLGNTIAGAVVVPGPTTQDECKERVMSQHPTAKGASFQVDDSNAPWCDALFTMTQCDLSPCDATTETCTVEMSTLDPSRPKAVAANGDDYLGYTCAGSGATCVEAATTSVTADASACTAVKMMNSCKNDGFYP